MSYTKQEFKSGEKLFAAQLNAMDEQIAANAAKGEELSEEIADNVLPQDARNLLIQILRSGVYNDDVSLKIAELALILRVDTTEYVLAQGSLNITDSGAKLLTGGMGLKRLSLFANDGEAAISDTLGNMLELYPISIPSGVVAINVIKPSDFKHGCFFASLNNSQYVREFDSGWIGTDINTFDVPSEYSDGEHYLFINFAKTDSSAITPEEYAGLISVSFLWE